jgi:phage-related protein
MTLTLTLYHIRYRLCKDARVEAGTLLRLLQEGESLGMPHSRPMPSIGPGCHELRVRDENRIRRIVYRLDPDRILIAGILPKTTRKTAGHDIQDCKRRPKRYDQVRRELGR